MIILGIDPGIARTGWGIIQVQSAKCKAQSYGCIETKKDLKDEQRLKLLFDSLSELIDKHKPDVLAVEELFFNTNSKTALIVGQARGVVLLAGAIKGISVESYTPLEVKVALTGYGRSEKHQVGQMVKTLLRLQAIPKPDDTADALAVAITHASSKKW